MQLLVIRHARSESVKEFAKTGASDDLRPLTDDGRERMRIGAAGLHRVVDAIDVLATSPLVRARETAEITGAEFDVASIVELEELRPEARPWEFVEWLQEAGSNETIAIIGHDMHLSELVGLLMTGMAEPVVKIKKGAAVMLDVRARGRRHAGLRSGRLLWSLTPRQLRLLGGEVTSRDAG
jgi:phosphohistidine phosphatase